MAVELNKDNLTGIPEIDLALKGLSKKFSIDCTPEDYGDILPIPTGSLSFDIWTQIQGLPDGRIIEIIGEPGSMKTSLALMVVASRQRWRKENGITGKFDYLVDLEHTLTRSFIEGFGIDMNQVLWKRFYSIEPALQSIIDLVKTGKIHSVLYDSVDAAQSMAQLDKDVNADIVGGSSKIMSKAIREIAKICTTYETQYLFINQYREKIGVMFGDTRTTTGGKALPYYATMRLACKSDKKGHPDVPSAAKFTIKCLKTKCSAPINTELVVPFTYGKGIESIYDIVNVAKDLDILRHSSGQTKVQFTADSEMEPIHPEVEKGKQACFDFLQANPLVLKRLEAACLRASGMKAQSDEYFLELIEKQETTEIEKTQELTDANASAHVDD